MAQKSSLEASDDSLGRGNSKGSHSAAVAVFKVCVWGDDTKLKRGIRGYDQPR